MGKRVLVVDDHPPVLSIIEDILERAGLEVLKAGDGAECLRKVREEQPDLVILDLMMPGKDGFEVLREIRAQSNTKYLPVIVLTARDTYGDMLKGWMAGAHRYLTKPCLVEELVSAVNEMLQPPVRH